jgi:HK97 family phage major capsid protein
MNADPKNEFRNLAAELKEAVLNKNQEQIGKVNERLDALELNIKSAATPAKSEGRGEDTKMFVEAAKLFANGGVTAVEAKFGKDAKVGAMRNGETKSDNLVRFDLAAAGALLLPAEMSADINRQVVEVSPVLQVAKVINTSAPVYRQAQRNDSLSASWLEEDAAGTKVKDTFGYVDIPVHKLAARVAWTIEQESDAAYDLANEINLSIREQFEKSLGTAFINGDGVKKPSGIVGNVTNFNPSGSLTLTSNLLLRFQASLKSFYQANASWMANRQTYAAIRQLVLSSTNGLQYTWEPSFQAGVPARLLGNPIFEAPDLVGNVTGVFTNGQVPLLYGDFGNGYTVARHTDFYVIRDQYSEASSFVTNLHVMSRFGGSVVRSEAIAQYTATT